ncbi:hypothetical protein ON010_g5845 [Phytophthora cinnamomi]|nr:hypothetical protein ON010_g5845 [Phytophthora cinnamomi]
MVDEAPDSTSNLRSGGDRSRNITPNGICDLVAESQPSPSSSPSLDRADAIDSQRYARIFCGALESETDMAGLRQRHDANTAAIHGWRQKHGKKHGVHSSKAFMSDSDLQTWLLENSGLARDKTRWNRLNVVIPDIVVRFNPEEMDIQDWRLLHLMPYVVSVWAVSALTVTPHAVGAAWSTSLSAVNQLCSEVLQNRWSVAINIAGRCVGTGGETPRAIASPSRRN